MMASPLSHAQTYGEGATQDFAFTNDDFARIAALLHRESGIHLHKSKAARVYARLAKRLRALKIESFRDYCALVAEDSGERLNMLAALTTNVTRFFREPHHFDHLRRSVLPPLLDAARRGAAVRLWSAGCSSGQEPYSIALTVLSMMPDAATRNIRILATDIDPHMLAKGRSGVYGPGELGEVSAEQKKRWFEPAPGAGEGSLRAGRELRALVAFRALNLIGPWPMRGLFHAIFCRNVVIYFDETTQAKLWGRLLPILSPGGCLYIGHSERVNGPSASALESVDITTYRRLDGARP